MKIEPFALERFQSTWEHHVAWNVAESGVHPLHVHELLESAAERDALLALPLGYPQTNGTIELRSEIASMYPGATPEHVQVTNGGSEANLIAVWHLVAPGDEVVMMAPNYLQMRGVAAALGAAVRPWPLVCQSEAGTLRWRADLDRLSELVTERTRLILICNPNNPTGARLTAEELDSVCRAAERVGAWVLADEIYRGAELNGDETPSIWGRSDRVLVTSGLSKAYGLPGLRIGWVVGPPDLIESLWGVHDYTTIAPTVLSDRLARFALAPERRERIIARTRGIIRTNYPVVKRWIDARAPRLAHAAPEAGAIVFVRYDHAINSTALAERLRVEHSVLVVPGDHFDMDGYLRIGFGTEPLHLTSSLDRIGQLLDTIPAAQPRDAC